MQTNEYRYWLLRKAEDAAERAKWAADPHVKAAWQRIEANYRMTAAAAPNEATPPTKAQAGPSQATAPDGPRH